ncbi:HigA family addiction module antitoxin [Marinimicrobium sp. C2-29]|uniref:HigA family addiction module antitoxin n=1 Tax=Marinimicrobium sp. C2-29 TaxID=3139825 RepID=UPI0031394950
MAISNTTGIQRQPTHPGEILREDFIRDYGLSVARLAELLGVSRQSVNELLRERRSVSPESSRFMGGFSVSKRCCCQN